MSDAFVWSETLAECVANVANDFTQPKYPSEDRMRDVRSRAREFVEHQRIGAEMTRTQHEYFICLLQRLEPSYVPSHKALWNAWHEAWEV